MAQAAELTLTKLREQLHLILLPPDREWGILRMDKYPYIAFLNMEDDITKRKIIIRGNLHVEIYLKEKFCPYIQVERLKSVNDVNLVLFHVNRFSC